MNKQNLNINSWKKWEKPTMSKYKNKKVVVDNILFDSKKEANYYIYLKMLEDAGKIVDLELQRKFVLQPTFKLNEKTYRAITYIADFVYKDDKGMHVVDVKSEATRKDKVYRLKKKMFAYKYHIEIEEVI